MNSRRATRALPLAVFALVAVAGLGAYFALVSNGPLGIDNSWRNAVLLDPDSALFTVAAFLAEIGSVPGVTVFGAIAASLLIAAGCGREAAQLFTAVVLGVAMSESMKFLVARPRPNDSVYSFDGSSFPSGHAVGAAALTFSIAYAISSLQRQREDTVSRAWVRLFWIAAVVWTLCMMWSRTALGVHWFSDVVAGAAVGIAATIISQRIWGRHQKAR